MTQSNTIILYVADPEASARFYAGLLGQSPVENRPGFAMFVLPSGLSLGLWQTDGVVPAVSAPGGGCELGFKVSRDEVERLHAEWQAAGATITLPPTDLGFGRSFMALDPDGHRLRVYAMAAEMAA